MKEESQETWLNSSNESWGRSWGQFFTIEGKACQDNHYRCGERSSMKITEAILNAQWGADLKDKDYPKFFNTETKKVSNGKVSFDLREKPVFVEIDGKAII